MARLSTLGVTFSFGIETSAGQKPTTFYSLPECSSIGGISLETAQIDVSTLEDLVTQYTAGRQDTGGQWECEFVMDPARSIPCIKDLYEKSKAARQNSLKTWFQVTFPDMADAFFVVAETGNEIPMPEVGQDSAATMGISLIINEYKGLLTKVAETVNPKDTEKASA